jgi:transposase
VTGRFVPLFRDGVPGPMTLRRLYVVELWSMAELAAQFQVGSPTVRRWLLEADIAVRPRGAGGFRRQLTAPPAQNLNTLAQQGLSAPEIAKRLDVGSATVRRWFAEAGLEPPSGSLKNRPRGATAPVQRPTADRLRQLYVQNGLSIAAVAERLNSTTHLIRTWLLEDGIPIRAAGSRPGVRRPGMVRKPSPPAAELRRLREQERLSRTELAARYQVHPQTVSGWLTAAGLPGHLPPPVSDAQVAAMYRAEPITAAEIARRVGISADQGELAVQYYQDQGWSYRMIGEELGVSPAKVRSELQRRGIPVHRRQPVGPGSRASRAGAPVEKLRKLYVQSEWSAQDVAAQLDSTVHVVLRTGHAHGVPIRQGGGGRPAVTAAVALIDGLYRDEQIRQVLDRHAVPRRPAVGDIAMRFPDPVPMTAQLLDELYTGAGCSSSTALQRLITSKLHLRGGRSRPEAMNRRPCELGNRGKRCLDLETLQDPQAPWRAR